MKISIAFRNDKIILDTSYTNGSIKAKDFFSFVRRKYDIGEAMNLILVGDNVVYHERELNETSVNPNQSVSASDTININPNSSNNEYLKYNENPSKEDMILISIDNFHSINKDDLPKEKEKDSDNLFLQNLATPSTNKISMEELIMKTTGANEKIKPEKKRKNIERIDYFGHFMRNDSRFVNNTYYHPYFPGRRFGIRPSIDLLEVDDYSEQDDNFNIGNIGNIGTSNRDGHNINEESDNSNLEFSNFQYFNRERSRFLGRMRERQRERERDRERELISNVRELVGSNSNSLLNDAFNSYNNLSMLSGGINGNSGGNSGGNSVGNNSVNNSNGNTTNLQNDIFSFISDDLPFTNLINSHGGGNSGGNIVVNSNNNNNTNTNININSNNNNNNNNNNEENMIRNDDVTRLTSEMGFEESMVRSALRIARNNSTRAVNLLLNRNFVDSFNSERRGVSYSNNSNHSISNSHFNIVGDSNLNREIIENNTISNPTDNNTINTINTINNNTINNQIRLSEAENSSNSNNSNNNNININQHENDINHNSSNNQINSNSNSEINQDQDQDQSPQESITINNINFQFDDGDDFILDDNADDYIIDDMDMDMNLDVNNLPPLDAESNMISDSVPTISDDSDSYGEVDQR